MRDYIKPSIEEELLELEDVIAVSAGQEGDSDSDGDSGALTDLW